MMVNPSANAKFKTAINVTAKRQDFISAVCPTCLARDDILVISVDGVDTFYHCTCGEAWTLDAVRAKVAKSQKARFAKTEL